MVLIFSSISDPTTDFLISWFKYKNIRFIRLNGEDLFNNGNISFSLKNRNYKYKICGITCDKIDGFLFRRYGEYRFPILEKIEDFILRNDLKLHMSQEIRSLKKIIQLSVQAKTILGDFDKAVPNKFQQLLFAREAGLLIPDTIICNNKLELNKLINKNKTYITKPISDGSGIIIGGIPYGTYTSRLSKKRISELPGSFFPIKIQEEITKEYEIRVFFINKRLFSMAIFSQNDEKTMIDFRRYNFKRPNRFVPYKLPLNISKSLHKYIRISGFTTGSIDMIKSVNGKYYFLEINPVGQFSFLSDHCNYNIEKIITEQFEPNKK